MISQFIVIGVVVFNCVTTGLCAEEFPQDPSEAYQLLIAEYYNEVAIRPEWSRNMLQDHTAETLSILDGEDGNDIVECEAGIFVWNATLENVELWSHGEQQSLTLFVDGVGRMAFEGTDISGYVDTLDSEHLFFLVEINGSASLWVWEVDLLTNNINPVEINPTRCVCKGSENLCPNGRIACAVAAGCTYTDVTGGAHNSTCQWKITSF